MLTTIIVNVCQACPLYRKIKDSYNSSHYGDCACNQGRMILFAVTPPDDCPLRKGGILIKLGFDNEKK